VSTAVHRWLDTQLEAGSIRFPTSRGGVYFLCVRYQNFLIAKSPIPVRSVSFTFAPLHDFDGDLTVVFSLFNRSIAGSCMTSVGIGTPTSAFFGGNARLLFQPFLPYHVHSLILCIPHFGLSFSTSAAVLSCPALCTARICAAFKYTQCSLPRPLGEVEGDAPPRRRAGFPRGWRMPLPFLIQFFMFMGIWLKLIDQASPFLQKTKNHQNPPPHPPPPLHPHPPTAQFFFAKPCIFLKTSTLF